MTWLFTILAGLLGAIAGGIGMLGLGSLFVRWFRISSFEGGSGYYVVALTLLGAIGGLIVAAVAARLGYASFGPAWYIQPATGLAAVTLALALVLGLGYLRADFEPDTDPRGLVVAWEIRLPVADGSDAFASRTPPADWPENELKLQLVNVRRGKTRGYESAVFNRAAFRQESGQWILPAKVPLFTAKGEFCVNLTTGGRDDGFWPTVPATPSEPHFEWSPWYRTNKGMAKPSDQQATMYRFRIEKQ
jgi:hypothetical protein